MTKNRKMLLRHAERFSRGGGQEREVIWVDDGNQEVCQIASCRNLRSHLTRRGSSGEPSRTRQTINENVRIELASWCRRPSHFRRLGPPTTSTDAQALLEDSKRPGQGAPLFVD